MQYTSSLKSGVKKMKITKISAVILFNLFSLFLIIGNVQSQGPLFDTPVNYAVGDYPRSVFSIDFNGDGDNDLATANTYSDNVSILLGNGDGTFQNAVNYAVGGWPRSVFSIDFNGDGYNDLATANANSDNVSILLNMSDPYEGCCIGFTGNVNCSEEEVPDISDITRLIDYLYISKDLLCCPEEADVNDSGGDRISRI